MKLEKYISDLLYRYDLVIIPGFGGLIGRRKSARINRDTYIFSPPYKELSFNVQLQQNDGLLANYIAGVNGMSYTESLQSINQTVEEWQRILQKEKRLKLDQIGIFNLINDDKILFLPLTTKNYLTDAYGLTAFVHKPVTSLVVKPVVNKTKTEKIRKPAKPVTEQNIEIEAEIPVEISTSLPVQNKSNNNQFWKYAAVFVAGLGIFTAGISLLRRDNGIQNDTVYQKATFVLKQDFPPVKIITHKSENIAKPVIKKIPVVPVEKYFIISGAFRNKTNAEKKIQMLKNAGYPAKIAGRNKFGLWMVAYQGFASHDKAAQTLNKIKKQEPGAWIYTKK